MTRILPILAGVALGAIAATVVWWPMLALFALLSEVDLFGTMKRAVVLFALPVLGAINGAIVGAMRGQVETKSILEMIASPFAWIMTAGEGMMGGVVMVLSLVPGACLGGLAGLWIANTPADAKYWPEEAGIGAVIGVTLSLVALNVFVQWPTLTKKREEKQTKTPTPAGETAARVVD